MRNVTVHPGLYAMTREDCPAWCVSGKRENGHVVERELHRGDQLLTAIDHASEDFDAGGGGLSVVLQRTTLWHVDGTRAGTVQSLAINDEEIPIEELPELSAALDRVRSALIMAGITGRF